MPTIAICYFVTNDATSHNWRQRLQTLIVGISFTAFEKNRHKFYVFLQQLGLLIFKHQYYLTVLLTPTLLSHSSNPSQILFHPDIQARPIISCTSISSAYHSYEYCFLGGLKKDVFVKILLLIHFISFVSLSFLFLSTSIREIHYRLYKNLVLQKSILIVSLFYFARLLAKM